jgi:hypothetical protein
MRGKPFDVKHEDEYYHDPFEFLDNDPLEDLMFSRLLIDVSIWE